MWTGQQALQSINHTLQAASSDIAALDETLTQLSERLTKNKCEQVNCYRSLAQLRLSKIEQETIGNTLSHIESQVHQALQQRQQLINSIAADIDNQQDCLSQLHVEREQQFKRVEEKNKHLLDSEIKAQQALEIDSDYQAQLKSAKKADAIADSAEEKLALAKQDRQQKGKPFEHDPLFIYLWKRYYGQPEYQANPLTRMLDNWVAKICRYSEARANYWLLLELPKRLAVHADTVRQKAENELHTLEVLEQSVAATHQVPECQQRLEQAQLALSLLDEKEQQLEQEINQLMEKQLQFSAGEDEEYLHIISRLSETLQRQDILELKQLSRRTIQLDDDNIVGLLVDLKEEEMDLQDAVRVNKQRQTVHLRRLQELKQLRHKFKQQRYDDFRSGFDNESLIAIALGEFLKGMLNSGDLWRTIERSQRYRNTEAWPDFGSGGLGRKGRRRSTWHWPGNHSGGNGGFRLPRSGGSISRGRGSGGFRTGGGF